MDRVMAEDLVAFFYDFWPEHPGAFKIIDHGNVQRGRVLKYCMNRTKRRCSSAVLEFIIGDNRPTTWYH